MYTATAMRHAAPQLLHLIHLRMLPGVDLGSSDKHETFLLTTKTDFDAALQLVDHASPDIRLAAVQLLAAHAKQLQTQPGQQCRRQDQAHVDVAFHKLCSVLTVDPWAAIRLQAVAGLSGLQHASLAARRQALSKRATYSSTVTTAAGSSAVDTGLLDSATGAFVHGTEDDSEQVRLATIACMQSLGTNDRQFSDEAAIILISSVDDELLSVRKAALSVLLGWATEFQQQYQQARLQKSLEEQQQQQQQQQDAAVQDSGMQEIVASQAQITAAAAEEEEGEMEQAAGIAADSEEEEGEWREQEDANQAAATLPNLSGNAAASTAAAAAAAVIKPPRGGRKVSKKRRGDTQPWAPDALAAAVSAMHDRDTEARELALQLALLLPPNGIQAVMGLLQGLIDCCQRFGDQHGDMAVQVVRRVAEQRAVYVGLAVAKIVKLLAHFTRSPSASAAAGRADGSSSSRMGGQQSEAGLSRGSNVSVTLIHEVLSIASSTRPQIATVVLDQMSKLGLIDLQREDQLQFVEHLRAMQQQHQQQQERQQEQ